MKTKLISLALLIGVVTAFAFGPMTFVQAAPAQALAVPVTGTSALGNFTGTFDIQRFAVQNGQLVAIGTLTGTVTDALGNVIRSVTNLALTIPVTNISATCEILHLELGPLDLDLLGLVVHLDRIVLDITAEQGGGLLGDLLCSLADLLGGNAALRAISQLLNNILRIIG